MSLKVKGISKYIQPNLQAFIQMYNTEYHTSYSNKLLKANI